METISVKCFNAAEVAALFLVVVIIIKLCLRGKSADVDYMWAEL